MWAWTKIKRWITAEKTGRYSLSRLLWNGWISGQCEIKQKPVLSFETKTKKTQNKPCRDVRFLSTFMVVSFSFFFFKKMDFPTLHHRPAAFKAATTHLIPNSHILPSLRMTSQRLSDTNRRALNLALNKQLLKKKKMHLLTRIRTPPTPPYAALTYTHSSQQPIMSCPELPEEKKKKKLTDVCGPGDIVLRMHP